jgi:CRP-like cAMP-binding protein
VVLLYIVLRGMVRVVDDNNATTGIPTVTMAGPGEYFGLESLGLFGTRSTKTYIAANNVSLCGINRETFEDEELFGVVYEKLESELRSKKILTEARPATPPTAPALLAGAGGAGAGDAGQSSASATRLSGKSTRSQQQQQQQRNNDDNRSDIVQLGATDNNGKKDPALSDYIPVPTLGISLW